VIQEEDENLDGSFDLREESLTSRGENVSNHVGGDLLLDGNGSVVSSDELLDPSFLLLEVLEVVVVVVLLSGFGDGFDKVCRKNRGQLRTKRMTRGETGSPSSLSALSQAVTRASIALGR